MPRVIRRRWRSEHAGPYRKDNRGCEYEAYVPDPLVGRALTIEDDIADSEAVIARLHAEATSLVDIEALTCILLRAESVASSRIKGLKIGAGRLLCAEAGRGLGDDPSGITGVEAPRNIDAMAYDIERVRPADKLTVRHRVPRHAQRRIDS